MSGDTTANPESPAQLNELLDNAPCGFLSFSDDGTIARVNRTLLSMLGAEHHEIIGRHLEKILNVGSRIFYQTHWFPLLRLNGAAEEIFLMLVDRTGAEIGVLVNAVRHERAGVPEYDCVLMRVRERQKFEAELLRARRAAESAQKRLEEQAVELEMSSEELRVLNEELLERTHELERAREVADEANAAKSSFLAVMSHELRTPLNAIAGYVDLIDMGIQGPVTEKQHDALDRIRRAQRHLLRLINDILNLSRIEAGRLDFTIEDLPLALVLDDVRPLVEPQLSDRGLQFELSAPPHITARADREKVQQIVLNLLSNAIKFTRAGGTVAVAVSTHEHAPDMVFLRVSDTGIGIAEHQLQSVFEPFVQLDTSAASAREGTGLGLAISRDLARGMLGDLRARSVPGEGSTFTLSLPAASSAHAG
jgi:PAS domain S-box-containing protein